MRTLHKLTHRPLARRLLTLAFFIGLGAAGWLLPQLGAATLAYSNQAYVSVGKFVDQAFQTLPGTNPVSAKAAAAVLNPAAIQDLSPETAKLLANLYGQSEYSSEFAQEELFVLGRLGKPGATPLTQLEADTVLSRVLYSVYVAKTGVSRAQDSLLRAYRAAVTAAGRVILDEQNPNPGKGGSATPAVSRVAASPNVAITAAFTEGFNDITTLTGAGWSQQNLSSPLGTTNWFQGNPAVFPAQAGATNAYIGANFNNTGSVGTISNWLLTPELALKNGDQIKFWTRIPAGTEFPDRLEVRLSTAGASTNVGATATSVGDFTTVLLSINPTLVTGVYPQVWTQFTVTISGLGAATTGRVGFRYFVTNGGANGANSNFIGIDTFEYAPLLSQAVIMGVSATLTAESCTPANNVPDPGETVTVSLCLKNTGAAAATDLVATLAQNPLAGILNPSAPQSFGALPNDGSSVCRPFTFTVPSAAVCGGVVMLSFGIADNGAPLAPVTSNLGIGTTNAPTSTVTFTQNTPIVIPNTATPVAVAPYPSALAVAGVTGTVVGVKVMLNGVSHTFPDDLDVMLVGPTGVGTVLLSDAGGGTDAVNTNLTFADGSPYMSDGSANASGSYSPTGFGSGDTFPAPAPAVPAGGPLNALFAGLNPNGTWNLFVVDDATGDGGQITSWSIEFTTSTVTPTINNTPFTNAAAITVNDVAAATPYPSTISVSGVTGIISNIAVKLNGVNHTFPGDMDMILVGPTGVAYSLLSDTGGGTDLVATTLTIQDGSTVLPSSLAATTTLGPSNSGAADAFPAPAPGAPLLAPSAGAASLLGSYGGLNPNGTWSLFIVDDATGDAGDISGGWTLTFTTINFPTTCSTCPTCTVTPPANVVQGTDPNLCTAVVNYTAPTTSGTCGAVTCVPPSGSIFQKGVTPVNCTSASGGGFASFTVTVNDTQAPAITCPANITTNVAAGTCAATVTFALPTVTDNCPGVGTPVCTPASGTSFAKGVTTVNCTVADAAGNPATCAFTVTVVDNIAPVLTCPPDISVGTSGNSFQQNNLYTPPQGTDNCPPSPIVATCVPGPGATFPIGTTTVTCSVTDAANNTTTCAFRVHVNRLTVGSLTDPLACTGPGNKVNGSFAVTNNSAVQQTVTATVALGPNAPIQGLLALSCAASTGTCTIAANGASISYTATLAAAASATVSYVLQVNDGVPPGTVLTSNVTASFNGGPPVTAGASTQVNCALAGPGAPFITAAERTVMSDQRAGSILFYPIYNSDASGGSSQNARISLTNTSDKLSTFVHLFFVDGASCSVSDAFVCLTPNQTTSFLTSDLDPGTRGYIVAVATDANGCPKHFNYLIGDEFVKFATGHAANLGAEAVPAIAGSPFWVSCDGSQPTATLRFNSLDYGAVPYTVAADSIGSIADGNNTLLVLNRIGGDLQTGPSRLVPIFGTLYDDSEISYSFNLPTNNLCQYAASLTDSVPRTTPRLSSIIPAGRTGWFKIAGISEIGIFGATINYNPNTASSSGAYNGGHNLHKLTFTNAMTYTIPIFPPTC